MSAVAFLNEISQNIRTSLAQVVSEELHAPARSIRLVMADTAAVPFDAGTFGNRTTPAMASQLRRAAADGSGGQRRYGVDGCGIDTFFGEDSIGH